MMTSLRAVLTVRPHIPLIKFRGSLGGVGGAVNQIMETSSPQSEKTATPTPALAMEWEELPFRYRRKPISDEELAYIMRGGPE
ncbi:hypothetical protein ScPMuIL_018058 [Solemya velum]